MADKHAALVLACGAAWNGDGVNVLGSVASVVRNGFRADVIDRFFKNGVTTGLGHGRYRAFSTVTTHQVDAVGFVDVEVGVVEVADLADLYQRNRHVGIANRQGNGFEVVFKAELERHGFLAAAGVVDVDFIQRVGVHLEVVRAAIRSLQRLVIGQQRDVV